MQNQMNYNPAFYAPNYAPQMHNYSQPSYKTPNNQPISFEQQEMLRARQHRLDMKITQENIIAAMCTHKDVRTGDIAYTIDSDGMCHCAICGAKWKMTEQDLSYIKANIESVKNAMQTIKCMYYDIPAAIIEEVIAPMMCLLDKLEALWNAALDNFKKYEDMNFNTVNPMGMYGGGNAFNQYQSMTTFASFPQFNPQMTPYNPQMQQFNPQMMPNQGFVQQPANPQMNNQGAQQFNPQMMAQGGYFGNMTPDNPLVFNGGFNPAGGMSMNYGAPVAATNFNNAPGVGAMPDTNNAPAAPAATNATGADTVQQQKVYNI